MENDDIKLSINNVRSRILQIFPNIPEAEMRSLNTELISKLSGIDQKQILSLLMSNMSESAIRNLLERLEKWQQSKVAEKRKHPRKSSFIPVDCSSEGANGNFYVGQQITLIFSLPKAEEEINIDGEVVRLDSEGIGVKFNEPLTFI
jgi:hypothetical protein